MSMKKKEFCVLQAVYRGDNPVYLNESLLSISEQTLKPQKIIVVKDGNIGEELDAVLSKWKKKLPLCIVGYEKNAGLACALNFGLRYVDTEYVARMDSDDICFSNRFEKQIEFFKQTPDAMICGTALEEFYEQRDGVRIKKNRFYPQIITKESVCLFRGTPIAHPTVMINSDLLKKYGYSERTKMNEDIELWFRLLIDGVKIYNIQEPLLHFRITDSTFNRRSIQKAKNEYLIYMSNLRKMFGISHLYVFPFLRFCFRFLPSFINKKIYFSNVRGKILEK